ncbi:hypothetical protein A7K91_08260 [Paenibacillus oryzae]|uniref:Beta-galactosidase trimerisation domain-containing protein n=1 Tax=Paenibacillus oryzae TaxID=1844972 RepID=A0A1A5YDN9_9BACL|nr:family 10 glycosylhydrolase [Paenibacillus oryzae]OBR63751.1 hypothetical protein A7K91_08260 [Paenibacillus oryzae]
MSWWTGNTLRLVQNNLREVDADLDVDKLISQLKAMDANVLMMNAGGMFAFYPSRLPYQYVTPYLKGDLLGETIHKAHKNGIRFIARFDFSKAHESIFEKRPEWFYRTRDGKEVNYSGIVHTCLNGGYQQQNSLVILEEALTAYDVDGVFFNMFGYQNWDYSGNYYGICHCDNCRVLFKKMYGLELPPEEDRGNETFRKYREFQEKTSMAILEKIASHLKKLRPDIAISTYHPHKVDIVRHESNTALNRPLPKWLYSAAENIMPIMGSYAGKLVSNCSINAIDLTYRFTGVSRQETEIRLYESLLSGSGLDFCIIGAFEGYPDRENLETVSSIFRYHKQHEALFGQLQSVADVVLVKPSPSSVRDSSKEYFGVFKMLKESHIQFDVIKQDRLERLAANPAKIVILPGVEKLETSELEQLAEWRKRGLHIVATGGALAGQPEALRLLFHAAPGRIIEDTTASYVRVDDKTMFPQMALRDWVVVDGAFATVSFGEGATKRLPYIASASFGPPERAYGHAESPELYALGIMPPGVLARPDSGSAVGGRMAGVSVEGRSSKCGGNSNVEGCGSSAVVDIVSTDGESIAGDDSIVESGAEGEGSRIVGVGSVGEGGRLVGRGAEGEGSRIGEGGPVGQVGRLVGRGAEGEGSRIGESGPVGQVDRLVGGSAYVCWNIGELYFRHGFADYRWILLGALHALVPEEQRMLSTNAHPSVEITLHRLPDGSRLLQLLNLSGFNGMTYEDPIPIGEIEISLQGRPINTDDSNNQYNQNNQSNQSNQSKQNNQNKQSNQRAELPAPIALVIPGRSTTSVHTSMGAEARAVWRIRDGMAVLVVSGLGSYAAFHLK